MRVTESQELSSGGKAMPIFSFICRKRVVVLSFLCRRSKQAIVGEGGREEKESVDDSVNERR
jgi:Holliday junction resolvasome RuvABC endonuclease subunit